MTVPSRAAPPRLGRPGARQRADLVLLDIMMPGMDGVEALHRIKAIDVTIPVIMVTATADETTARETLKTGAFDYVTEPFHLAHLSEVVAVASRTAPTAGTPVGSDRSAHAWRRRSDRLRPCGASSSSTTSR